MIRLHQLSFGYSRRQLLFDKLNLQLFQGHIYGLFGKNGAGKSSLLRNIVGLLFPDSGTIEVLGHIPEQRRPEFLEQVFFIPEEVYLPAMPIYKFMKLHNAFYSKFNEEQFRYYLKEFNVAVEQQLAQLSYGQRKKVLIAFALACNTQLLIMDEPTNGLDIPSKSQFRKLVSSVLQGDRLILISTHQGRDLDNLIDAVIVLNESEILLHQPLEQIGTRLKFTTLSQTTESQQLLYTEPSLQGYAVVMENDDQIESKVDLERLFNAAIHNPERLRQLFTPIL